MALWQLLHVRLLAAVKRFWLVVHALPERAQRGSDVDYVGMTASENVLYVMINPHRRSVSLSDVVGLVFRTTLVPAIVERREPARTLRESKTSKRGVAMSPPCSCYGSRCFHRRRSPSIVRRRNTSVRLIAGCALSL